MRTSLERAAALLRQGGLVAFPTETVYGLGANALDAAAVARIFEVKRRPSTSPLIVHVDSVSMARRLAAEWPEAAEKLAARYWPGPLTLVLPKRAEVPDLVTAGLGTVGLRVPNHPLALELIRLAGVPVAAPSANRFAELSPTTAEHVRRSLGAAVDLVVDGGPCPVGIESAVLSLAGGTPVLLRPGGVPADGIEAITGPLARAGPVAGSHPSPGMHERHYSPRTPLVLVDGGSELPAGSGAYVFHARPREAGRSVAMPADAQGYAAALYGTLHRLDSEGWEWIAVEGVPGTSDWEGVRDRLRRAAGGRTK